MANKQKSPPKPLSRAKSNPVPQNNAMVLFYDMVVRLTEAWVKREGGTRRNPMSAQDVVDGYSTIRKGLARDLANERGEVEKDNERKD
jgi:hypothetical protein